MTSRAKRDQSTNSLHERDESSIDSGSSGSSGDSDDAWTEASSYSTDENEKPSFFRRMGMNNLNPFICDGRESLHSSDLYASRSDDSAAYTDAADDYIDGEKEIKNISKKLTRGIDIIDGENDQETLPGASRLIDCNSVMARLYRAIDAKEWKTATDYLIETPELASYWVYRRDEGQKEVSWMFLPIHAACFSGAPPSFVSNLIRAYPESVDIGTGADKLPIHIACETGAYHAIVSCLVIASPKSLYHKDNDGNTPLQLCILSTGGGGRNRDNIIQILTEAAAEAERSDMKQNQFRLSVAERRRRAQECFRSHG